MTCIFVLNKHHAYSDRMIVYHCFRKFWYKMAGRACQWVVRPRNFYRLEISWFEGVEYLTLMIQYYLDCVAEIIMLKLYFVYTLRHIILFIVFLLYTSLLNLKFLKYFILDSKFLQVTLSSTQQRIFDFKFLEIILFSNILFRIPSSFKSFYPPSNVLFWTSSSFKSSYLPSSIQHIFVIHSQFPRITPSITQYLLVLESRSLNISYPPFRISCYTSKYFKSFYPSFNISSYRLQVL